MLTTFIALSLHVTTWIICMFSLTVPIPIVVAVFGYVTTFIGIEDESADIRICVGCDPSSKVVYEWPTLSCTK